MNLATTYSRLLDERFKQKSLTERFCGHNYSWDGSNAIKVWTIDQVELHKYGKNAAGSSVTTNRFSGGNFPTDIGDSVATYVLANDLAFSTGIDSYTNADQMGIKKANSILKQIWDEQIVPEQDKFRLNTWSNGAGVGKVGSQLSNQTIVRAILEAQAALNNKLVGREGRVCFVSESLAVETQLANELQYNRDYTSKAIINGEITRMGSLPIVAVPDDYMPSGVQFMVKWTGATADPQKLKMLRTLENVQGHYGPIMEGLVRFDSFVLAQKANGIYTYGLTNGMCVAPAIDASTASATAITTTTSSATIKYTVDGSNPKTSATAQTYSSTINVTSSCVIKAYASKSGLANSPITELAVTV